MIDCDFLPRRFLISVLDTWILDDISQALQVDDIKAKELLAFWEKQGILMEEDKEKGVYRVLETANANTVKGRSIMKGSKFQLTDIIQSSMKILSKYQ